MSLPTTISFSIDSADDLVCEKANQDNFGVTYRGSLETATQNIVAVVKVNRREEGTNANPKERHSIDATFTHYPLDGSPSYVTQSYVHMIKRRGSSSTMQGKVNEGIAQSLNPATSLGSSMLEWVI